MNTNTLVIVGAIVAIVCLGLAAVLFLAEGSEATNRLALFFGLIGIVVPSLLALLKSSQAAANTNGSLDARIREGVHEALNERMTGLSHTPEATMTPPAPVTPTPDGA